MSRLGRRRGSCALIPGRVVLLLWAIDGEVTLVATVQAATFFYKLLPHLWGELWESLAAAAVLKISGLALAVAAAKISSRLLSAADRADLHRCRSIGVGWPTGMMLVVQSILGCLKQHCVQPLGHLYSLFE